MNDLWPENELPEEGRTYQYRIVNVENILGEPVVENTLIDGKIDVPVQGRYAPEFACYIITRQIIE